MNKRLKKILMLVFAVTLLLPQLGIAQKASAAIVRGSNVIYDMQQDSQLVGSAVEYTDVLQNSGVKFNVVDNSGAKAIEINGRTGNYHGVDIKTSLLNAAAGTSFNIRVYGRIPADAVVPSDSQMLLGESNGKYSWLNNVAVQAGESFTLDYTIDSAKVAAYVAAGTNLRVQSNTVIDKFIVDDIMITTNLIYDMQQDSQLVGSAVEYTAALQNSGVKFNVVDNSGAKAIEINGRTGNYNGVDIKTSLLNAAVGASFHVEVQGRIPADAVVPNDSQMLLGESNGKYSWLNNVPVQAGESFKLEYTIDSAKVAAYVAAGTNLRVQSNTVIDKFVVDSIIITTGEASTDPAPPTDTPPPVSDEVVVAYDLQEDAGLVDLMTNGGTEYLTKAGGPTLTPQSNTDGTTSLEVSNRVNSWDGVDVRAAALGLAKDAEFSVELAGHIPAGVTIPSDAAIVLGLASDPYSEFESAAAAADFTLSYEGVWDAGAGLRIQASAGLAGFVIDSLIIHVQGGIKMPSKPLPTVPGVHVSSTAYGDSWSGANIILGLDAAQWPFSTSSADDVVAFTPVKDAKYHLTFNATSTGATGYRVRWITGNENGGYTGADAAVVSDAAHTYAAGTAATTIPGSFTSGVVKGETLDYTVDFVMSGSEVANGLIGNIGIRGTAGNNDFTINSLTITDDNGTVLVNWSSSEDPFVPDDYEWPASKWDVTTLPSLKDAYRNYFLIGNILGWGGNADAVPWGQENDQADAALKDSSIIAQTEAMFKAQYNVVTAENVMKPENISKSANTYDYTAADKLMTWSKANNIAVHGHTLIWHQQSPAWLNKGDAANRASAKANLESYIANVAGHYKGQLISWDVVNEAFSDNTATFDGKDWRTGLRKDSPWYIAYANGADESKGESGADYIYDAFVAARLIDPDATLYYNDYNETYKYEQIAQMAESLNEKWAADSRNTDPARKLVEGIGMQSHFWVGQDPDVEVTEVETTIERFIEADLRISVSELDIPFAKNNNYHLDEARQAEQAELYGTLFEIYKKYADHIDRVTFWGKADIQSWRSSGMPVLFDNSYAPKAAFWKVIELGDEPAANTPPSGSGYVPSVTDGTTGAAAIDTKDGQVTIAPKVEAKNGAATAAVSSDDLSKALKQAAANADGKKQVTVDIPAQAGAASYGVQLPAAGLTDSGSSVISIKTDKAAIDIPSSMLATTDVETTEQVTIRVSDASTAALSDDVRQQIGDRPVINLEVLVGGSVIAWNNPSAPVTVSIPYAPTAEELLNPDQIVVWYIDGSGQAIPVPNGHYDAAAGAVVFTTTHFSNYAVASVVKTFADIQSVTWAKSAVEAMAARGIINGTSDNSFSPNADIKRADFLVMLVRALELKGTNEQAAKFDDVNESDYYYDAVNIARQLGIVKGTGDNLFKPNSSISRQDMMVLAARAAAAAGKALPSTGTLDAFGDASFVSAYAKDSVIALVDAGIVIGSNGNLAPQDSLSRAEAAVILYRLWSK